MLNIEIIPCLNDNYSYIIQDEKTNLVGVVDPSDFYPIDSFLSKNIRPFVLIYLTVIFSALAFTDGNIGEFVVAKEYIPIFQTLLVTVYGAYFVGRSWEKAKKTILNK